MPDVVAHGPAGEPAGGGRTGARLLVLLLAASAVAFLVSRSGLLSAGPTERSDGRAGPTGPYVGEASRLVAQVGDRLVRLGQDDENEGARLPRPAPSQLVPVRSAAGTRAGVLVGTGHGLLFRVAASRAAANSRWAPIGRARSVVGASAVPGRAVIWRGTRVVEVEVATGRVVDEAPFPGFDGSAGWLPDGLVAVSHTQALLMSRRLPGDARRELALAWPGRRVADGTNLAVQSLGDYGQLVGIADDWVLTQGGACPGAGCRAQVVSVTRDDVLARDVVAPPGWVFVGGPLAGRTREALLPVQRADDEAVVALARVVAGGVNALLVGGTEGVDRAAGLVDTLAGDVYLVVREGGLEEVRVWRPERSGAAQAVTGDAALPDSARLVCVCG